MKRILIIVLAAAMVLTSCASDPANKDDTEEVKVEAAKKEAGMNLIDPCKLISKEEAESITGFSYDTVETMEEPRVGQMQCIYTSEDHEIFTISLTQKAAMPPEQKQTPESIYRTVSENFDDKIKVEGIGDEAYIFTPGLHILFEGYYILIGVGNLSLEENISRLKEAGKLAVTNLKALR